MTDTDYEVYEGMLGNFTTHVPVLCSTGGATGVTIAAATGSRYYFIVPHNGTNGGSYGSASAGTERPLGVASCRAKSVASCSSQPACGDGALDPGETCDDFNANPGDGCSAACLVEPGYTCVGQPSVCTPQPACGDGALDPGETCDDFNANSGDGCSAACLVEPGYTCVGQPSVCTPQGS
ncbi:MAG: DUF4215 domain-containing protein [Acidobacteria bacterium]|nr:DUF4215 domain-containing protein [Acidobacteriota bacterium]